MPWKVINQMDLKILLINERYDKHFSITDLSQKYGISRMTVYKWLKRYKQFGIDGLKEQSRAPNNCPRRTPKKILNLLIEEKLKNIKRGPRKIRAQLKRLYPNLHIPAASTVSYWLKKEGLVKNRKIRRRVPPYTRPFSKTLKPNDVWSIDYKGQFFMQNNRVCYPLTITDNYSRFILGSKALEGPRYIPTRKYIEAVFNEYGLPKAIRSDNGTPFAGRCAGGLSRLAVWWILLGIVPERIQKGCPQENGRHERMHRSLKNEVLDIPASNLREQQRVFDLHRNDFNLYRPHESLGDQVPADYYKKSDRPYTEHPPLPEYGQDCIVRRVRHKGKFSFKGRFFFVSELLAGYPVGLKEIADGFWQLQFSFYILGCINLRKNKFIHN